MGCLFLKLIEESPASPATPFPREPARETTSALHRRHWKGARDSTSEVFQVARPEPPVHKCVSKVLEQMFSGERLREQSGRLLGFWTLRVDVEIDETKEDHTINASRHRKASGAR
jgi:hypothetical protein